MLSVYGGHTATGLAVCIVDNERLEVILHDTTDIYNIYMGLNKKIFFCHIFCILLLKFIDE